MQVKHWLGIGLLGAGLALATALLAADLAASAGHEPGTELAQAPPPHGPPPPAWAPPLGPPPPFGPPPPQGPADEITRTALKEMFKRLDRNSDGMLSEQEFVDGVSELRGPPHPHGPPEAGHTTIGSEKK